MNTIFDASDIPAIAKSYRHFLVLLPMDIQAQVIQRVAMFQFALMMGNLNLATTLAHGLTTDFIDSIGLSVQQYGTLHDSLYKQLIDDLHAREMKILEKD